MYTSDTFIEKHIKRNDGGKGIFKRCLLIFMALMIVAALFAVPIVLGFYELLYASIPVSALVIWGFVVLFQRQFVEYEVEIVNDIVNVSKISGKKKRTELVEFSLKDCEYIGPVTEDRFKTDSGVAELKLVVTDKKDFPVTEDIWYVLVNRPEFKYMVVFPFDPEMFQVFRRFNPRNVYRYVKPVKAKESEVNE